MSKKAFEKHVKLFLIVSEVNSDIKIFIKHFNKLLYNKTKQRLKTFFCMNCLQCFKSLDVLENHRKVCLEIDSRQSTKMAEKDVVLSSIGVADN